VTLERQTGADNRSMDPANAAGDVVPAGDCQPVGRDRQQFCRSGSVDVASPGMIVRLGPTSLSVIADTRTPRLDAAVSSVFSGADPSVAVAGTWGMLGKVGMVSFIGVRHWLVLSLLVVANIVTVVLVHRQELKEGKP